MGYDDNKSIRLFIPADPSWVLVVRMALGGAGALMGLSVDLLDDLRSAADEACDCLLHQPRRVQGISLHCSLEENVVHTIFTCQWDTESQAGEPCDVAMTKGILETLIPYVILKKDGIGIWEIDLKLPVTA